MVNVFSSVCGRVTPWSPLALPSMTLSGTPIDKFCQSPPLPSSLQTACQLPQLPFWERWHLLLLRPPHTTTDARPVPEPVPAAAPETQYPPCSPRPMTTAACRIRRRCPPPAPPSARGEGTSPPPAPHLLSS